jgi:hypothetical protein
VPLLRAHLGLVSWESVLSTQLVTALGRLGWADWMRSRAPHFLSDNTRPERWMKLFFLAAAGEPLDGLDLDLLDARPWHRIPAPAEDPFDAQLIVDALRAMCLHNQQIDHHFVVRCAAPRGPIAIDLLACTVRAAGAPIDLAPPRYWFSPSVAKRLRATGAIGYHVELADPAAVPQAAAALLEGATGARGPGFSIVALG